MKHIDFYLDFISPYAYLAFERLPVALEGVSHSVRYKPLLLGALLKHHGQLGPAEVPPKREWTYRHVLWLGHANGIPIEMPATHPYSPLAHLRLSLATSTDGCISRHVAETIFRDVWRGGGEAGDAGRLAALSARLTLQRDPGSEAVKAQLKANTDEAVARGVFGVPAYAVDDRLIWGFDSLPMLRAAVLDDLWFEGPQWQAAADRPAMLRNNR